MRKSFLLNLHKICIIYVQLTHFAWKNKTRFIFFLSFPRIFHELKENKVMCLQFSNIRYAYTEFNTKILR